MARAFLPSISSPRSSAPWRAADFIPTCFGLACRRLLGLPINNFPIQRKLRGAGGSPPRFSQVATAVQASRLHHEAFAVPFAQIGKFLNLDSSNDRTPS